MLSGFGVFPAPGESESRQRHSQEILDSSDLQPLLKETIYKAPITVTTHLKISSLWCKLGALVEAPYTLNRFRATVDDINPALPIVRNMP